MLVSLIYMRQKLGDLELSRTYGRVQIFFYSTPGLKYFSDSMPDLSSEYHYSRNMTIKNLTNTDPHLRLE